MLGERGVTNLLSVLRRVRAVFSYARRYAVVASAFVFCSGAALAFLPASAVAEECPNAAFRTGPSAHLPDCRAYELVTPSFKNTGRLVMESIGPEGSPLLFDISASVAGLEGFPNISLKTLIAAYYSIGRTSSGWVTVPEDPPVSEYLPSRGDTDLVGESLNGDTVWLERRVGQPNNSLGFFMRRPDHSLVEIGTVLPPTAPPNTVGLEITQSGLVQTASESSDGSRLFFDLGNLGNGVHGVYWPGDRTHAFESLYEYQGLGNTAPPLLVGVNNRGEQIGECGDNIGGARPNEQYGESSFSHNAVSANGSTVFFTVFSGASCGGGGPPVAELFARIDNGLPGARTVSISEPSEEDCAACYEGGKLISASKLANAMFVGASEDGSKVFFETTQPLLGSDSSNNLYEYDFNAPAGQRIVRVSAGDATVSGATAGVMMGDSNDHLWSQVSQDGSHVYFLASGVLTKTPNRQGESAEAGAPNVYVFERGVEHPSGRLAFIATLSTADLGQSFEAGFESNVTPDGRFLVFTSNRDLTPDDTSTVRQVFEFDAQTGALVRVSIGENGYNHNGNTSANFTTIRGPYYEGMNHPLAYWSALSVSADGAYVFFQSVAALTPQAIEGFQSLDFNKKVIGYNNVYEYHDGQVSLISDGRDTAINPNGESVVEFIGTDASGRDVFFTTEDRLVGQDGDTNIDVYDARVGGGFPAPAAPVSCEGEACQGPLSGAPVLLSPGSEFQAGSVPPLAGEPVAQRKVKPKKTRKRPRGGRRRGARRGVGRTGGGRGGRS